MGVRCWRLAAGELRAPATSPGPWPLPAEPRPRFGRTWTVMGRFAARAAAELAPRTPPRAAQRRRREHRPLWAASPRAPPLSWLRASHRSPPSVVGASTALWAERPSPKKAVAVLPKGWGAPLRVAPRRAAARRARGRAARRQAKVGRSPRREHPHPPGSAQHAAVRAAAASRPDEREGRTLGLQGSGPAPPRPRRSAPLTPEDLGRYRARSPHGNSQEVNLS